MFCEVMDTKDAYYFPHDSNARNDEKCMYIISKYGLQGYGLYWMFVESMHEQADGKLTCMLLDGLAIRFNVDITVLKQFYSDAISIKLFNSDGEKYWSDRVLRNKKEFDKKRKLKSKAGKKGMAVRWNKDNTVITEPNTVITEDNKVKESKGKQIKGKVIKDIYITVQHLSLSTSEYNKLVSEYGKPLVDSKIAYAENYAKLKNYKSLYLTINNWLKKDAEDKPTDHYRRSE